MEETYPVMELFYTLQGEGAFSGYPAVFIRIGGCDVGCVWCDVKDSWDAEKHPKQTVTEIVTDVTRFPAKLVVITGGEPCLYHLTPITDALHQQGIRTHLETSGSSAITGHWDWICISPKKFKAPLPENLPLANELKIVVFNKSDFEWAETYAAMVTPACRLLLQPEWEKQKDMLPLIIDYIKLHPEWNLSVQTHKYINIP